MRGYSTTIIEHHNCLKISNHVITENDDDDERRMLDEHEDCRKFPSTLSGENGARRRPLTAGCLSAGTFLQRGQSHLITIIDLIEPSAHRVLIVHILFPRQLHTKLFQLENPIESSSVSPLDSKKKYLLVLIRTRKLVKVLSYRVRWPGTRWWTVPRWRTWAWGADFGGEVAPHSDPFPPSCVWLSGSYRLLPRALLHHRPLGC